MMNFELLRFLIRSAITSSFFFILLGCDEKKNCSGADSECTKVDSTWRDPQADQNPMDSSASLFSAPSEDNSQVAAFTPKAPVSVEEDPQEVSPVSASSNGWSADKSRRAQQIAASDDAGPGYCAKGTANILERMGYPVVRANAHDWDNNLNSSNGWKKITCQPTGCPAGAVLVFDRNNPPGSKGGARYGHTEIVTESSDGSKRFCSDACRNHWDGTVPKNYKGAWIYEGSR